MRFFSSVLELLELALEAFDFAFGILQVLVFECELPLQVCAALLVVEHAADDLVDDAVHDAAFDRDGRGA